MRRPASLLLGLLLSAAAQAQTLNVVVGQVTYRVPADQAGEMVYSSGTSLTILNKTFALSDITRMYVTTDDAVTDNTVTVAYCGTTAAGAKGVKAEGNITIGESKSTPTVSITQRYVSTTGSVSANSTVALKSGSTTLASFTIPSAYSASSTSGGGFGGGGQSGSRAIQITCAGLTSGSSYTLTNGSTSTTVTARTGSSTGGRW